MITYHVLKREKTCQESSLTVNHDQILKVANVRGDVWPIKIELVIYYPKHRKAKLFPFQISATTLK